MEKDKSLSVVSFKLYWIMYLPNLQDVRIPFQKFVESLSSELTFRLTLDPRLHFEFVPAGIIGRLLEIKTIRPSTFSTNMYSVSWILTLMGIFLSKSNKIRNLTQFSSTLAFEFDSWWQFCTFKYADVGFLFLNLIEIVCFMFISRKFFTTDFDAYWNQTVNWRICF